MGEHRHLRTAVDSRGKRVDIIEWQGGDGTADIHQGAYSRFYRFRLPDGTPLSLQLDNRTLLDDNHGKLYTLR